MTVPGNGNRARFRRLAVLIFVCFVDAIGFMIILPLLPFYATRLAATEPPKFERGRFGRILYPAQGAVLAVELECPEKVGTRFGGVSHWQASASCWFVECWAGYDAHTSVKAPLDVQLR